MNNPQTIEEIVEDVELKLVGENGLLLDSENAMEALDFIHQKLQQVVQNVREEERAINSIRKIIGGTQLAMERNTLLKFIEEKDLQDDFEHWGKERIKSLSNPKEPD